MEKTAKAVEKKAIKPADVDTAPSRASLPLAESMEESPESPENAARRMAYENQKLRQQLHEQGQKIQQMEQQLHMAKQATADLKGNAFDAQQTLLDILKKGQAYSETLSKQLQSNNNSLTELAALVINVAETPTDSEIEAAIAAKQLREQATALVTKYQIKRTSHEEANH